MAWLLVIEDEMTLLQSLVRGLTEEGYSVTPAATAADGFLHATSANPDAIVLDLMLPDCDGVQLVRDLRRKGFTKPILIVTARDAVKDRIVGLDSGADDYLVKPFAFSELLARLRALLRRNGASQETRLWVQDLELDVLTRQVVRGGEPINLTRRQYELLEYLLRNAHQIVSREKIACEVWKESTATWTNVIEVHINQLRKKIERPDAPPLLQTVRGKGYCLGGSP